MYILIVAIVLLLALLAVKFSDKFGIIVAKIIRNNKLVIPRGDTVICADDTVIIGGKSYFDPTGYGLVEITILSLIHI